jgi:ferric-dicitrate binding protein FerR (iron transport regulator)
VDEPLWQPVKFQDTFLPGDTIRVLERSRADVALLDQSVLRLNVNTTLTFKAVKEERTSVVDLLKGAAHFFSRGPRSLEVQTPFATAGIRGTEFFVRVEAEQTFLSIFEGTVVAANEAASCSPVVNQPSSRRGKRRCCGLWCVPGMLSNGPCITHPFSIFARMNFHPDPTGKGWFDAPSSFT